MEKGGGSVDKPTEKKAKQTQRGKSANKKKTEAKVKSKSVAEELISQNK